jgi:predicted DNA-binding mobile mystery protein A
MSILSKLSSHLPEDRDNFYKSALNLKQHLIPIPKSGWIKKIRTLMSMKSAQLANKLEINQSAVSQLERSEIEKNITLKSLEKVADALNCDLYYALIPRQPIQPLLLEKATQLITSKFERAATTMNLEDQSVEPPSQDRISLLATVLTMESKNLSEVWDED